MTIQEQIYIHLKNAILTSSDDVKSILRVVIGEFNRHGKNVSDDKAISIIKKLIDNAKERNVNEVNDEKRKENLNEINILETYLPQQLSESELRNVITNLKTSNGYTSKDMGKIMTFLKENFSGSYDGKLASSIAKELLS